MNVLIIEDEVPAADKLERYLKRYDQDIEVLDKLNSVTSAVAWLKKDQQKADLVFMDIQLLDGKSFEIFDQVKIHRPIIFITAFDEYAIDAFKVNSIDYLLKPITFDDLSASLEKFNDLKKNLGGSQQTEPGIHELLRQLQQKSYKKRFMVKLGEHIKSITADQVSFFFADGRNVYLVTSENRKFIIDFRLEDLEEMLDPNVFFRANRTFILNIDAITDVVVYSNSRLKVVPRLDFDKEIIVSREKVPLFKDWFGGLE